MTRKIFGVLGGVVVAYLAIMGSQMLSLHQNPFPEGLDPADIEAMKAYISTLPGSAFAWVLGGYVVGAFLGGLVATLISQNKYMPALIIGAFLTMAAIANAMMIAQPMWVSVAGVIVMIPFAWLGAKIVKLRS